MRGLLALALAAVFPAEVWAETLDSLIARHVEARGGRERLESIRSLRASGRALAGPGREALVTREVRTPGRIRTDYLEAETALIVRRESTRIIGDQTIDVETTYSDFRSVGGVMFPHSIKSGAKGRPDLPEGRPDHLEIIVEEAELNVPLDDARFEWPA